MKPLPREIKGEQHQQKLLLAEVEAVEGAERVFRFTVTTGSIDRQNDTIAPDGWELADFLKNPVILWAHNYSQPPIGRARSLTMDGNGLTAEIELAPAEAYPFAETIYQLIKLGYIRATSVGFRPLQYAFNAERGGYDFLKCELLEIRLVPVPANSEALIAASAEGLELAPLKEWAEQVLKDLTPAGEPAAERPPMVQKIKLVIDDESLAEAKQKIAEALGPLARIVPTDAPVSTPAEAEVVPAADPAVEPAAADPIVEESAADTPVAQADGDSTDVIELADDPVTPEPSGELFELVENEPAAGDGALELNIDADTLRSVIGDAFKDVVDQQFATLTGRLD